MKRNRPSEGPGSKAARVCRKCFSLQIAYLGMKHEKCLMCGHEQESAESEFLEEDEEAAASS